jgi:dihydropteroate synthase
MSVTNTLNCNGQLISLDKPVVMGIINVNDNSFYSASRANTTDLVLATASKMLHEGATILDLGAMSSKPGSAIISIDEELNLILPAVEAVKKYFPEAIISVDTLRSKVAKEVIHAGASMINDISAGTFDSDMMKLVSSFHVPYIMMHMKGLPSDMQQNPSYEDVVMEITRFFVLRIQQAKEQGIVDIVIDPGFGFGKTLDHNYQIMKKLEVLQIFDLPVMAGISRKSMIISPLNTNADSALNGTTSLHMYALQKGARILRVHDVKEAMECITLHQLLTN